MSKFQSTVSTIAALGTIAVTSVTAYKVFDNQQENTQKQQVIIQDLKQQLEERKVQQPITPPVYVVQQPVTPPPPVLPPDPEVPTHQRLLFWLPLSYRFPQRNLIWKMFLKVLHDTVLQQCVFLMHRTILPLWNGNNLSSVFLLKWIKRNKHA